MADPASAAMTAHQQMGTCAPLSARPDVRSWTHSHGCCRMYLESWAALISKSAWYIKWNHATASEYFSSSTEVTGGPSTFPVSLDSASSEHRTFVSVVRVLQGDDVRTISGFFFSPHRKTDGLARRRRRCSI